MGAPGAFMSRQIPAAAAWLGGAGLIPFVAAALLAMIPQDAELRGVALRAFVAQAHPEGRITFVDLDSGAHRTLTGFELGAKVVE